MTGNLVTKEERDAKKLVEALWGAAFRQGELEHRESVSNATLKKNSDAVTSAKAALLAHVSELEAELGGYRANEEQLERWVEERDAEIERLREALKDLASRASAALAQAAPPGGADA